MSEFSTEAILDNAGIEGETDIGRDNSPKLEEPGELTDAVTNGACRGGGWAFASRDELGIRAAVRTAGEQVESSAPLKIAGDLTIAAVAAQHALLARSVGQGSEVALDLSGIHECDTAGLQLIYSFRRTVLQRGERLRIVAVSLEIQELAAALGLQLHQLSNADSTSRSSTGGI